MNVRVVNTQNIPPGGFQPPPLEGSLQPLVDQYQSVAPLPQGGGDNFAFLVKLQSSFWERAEIPLGWASSCPVLLPLFLTDFS